LFFHSPYFAFFFRNAGKYLVVNINDKFHNADAVMVLMGSSADRVLFTHELCENNIPRIILIVEDQKVTNSLLIEKKVNIPNMSDLSYSALIQMGIPSDSITLLP
jgi:hypothetical protein